MVNILGAFKQNCTYIYYDKSVAVFDQNNEWKGIHIYKSKKYNLTQRQIFF